MTTSEVPYIAPPPQTENPPITGLICFLNSDRECGPDCASFTLNTPEGPEYERQVWAHCILLSSLYKASKHIVILAKQGEVRLKADKDAAADAVRRANTPATSPFTPPGK